MDNYTKSRYSKRLQAAEAVCAMVESQLILWDAKYPDRKDDSKDNRDIREVIKRWKDALWESCLEPVSDS